MVVSRLKRESCQQYRQAVGAIEPPSVAITSLVVDHSGDTPEARITNRLRNSGADAKPDVTVQKGEGPTLTHTNIHHAGHPIAPGTLPDKDADGKP